MTATLGQDKGDFSCYESLYRRHKVDVDGDASIKMPRFSKIPRARSYRTKITGDLGRGVTFAGHYNIAQWGCGIGCCGMAVTDTLTGEVVFYGPDLSKTFLSSSCVWDYHPWSTVLVMNGICKRSILDSPEVRGYYDSSGPRAYLWDGKQFKFINDKSYCAFDAPDKCLP